MLEQIILPIVLIPFIAVAARMAGGGMFKHPAGTGEAMLALPFAITMGIERGGFWVGALYFLWVFLWFQTGHGIAFHMGNDPQIAQSGRKAPLSLVIDPLCKALGKPLGEPFYCWAFMGLKGFLMHLPLGLWAFPMAILWPTAYWVGNCVIPKTIDGEVVAELLSGAFSGAILAAYIVTQ